MKFKYPKYQGTKENTLVLTEDYLIQGIVIPSGFESDGLTLKIRFLSVVVDKYAPKFSPFFFLHDYLCREERYKKADSLGEVVLFDIENSKRTRFGMWLIKKYHKFNYGETHGY